MWVGNLLFTLGLRIACGEILTGLVVTDYRVVIDNEICVLGVYLNLWNPF
jgi:hypothetical protein